jgi:hypothetical protein
VPTPLDPDFDRARLALLYVLGDKPDVIEREARSPEGTRLAQALANPDRAERAAVLAVEIRRIVRAIDDLCL